MNRTVPAVSSRRTAAVTGAASGIGRALALELAGRGTRLALADLDAAGLAATVEQVHRLAPAVGGQATATVLDVADRAAVQDWADATAAGFGADGVQLVFNNAGVALAATVAETDWADLEWLFGVNFWGVVHGSRAFLPHLLASGQTGPSRLVNISSVFGLAGVPTQSAYCAAKFAVRGFTESLRHEVRAAGGGLRVSTVFPGGVRTGIARNARTAPGQDGAAMAARHQRASLTSAERAARTILRGTLRGRSRIYVGPDATAVDLLTRFLGRAAEPLFRYVTTRHER